MRKKVTLKNFLKNLKKDNKIEVKWLDHYSAIGWEYVDKSKPVYCTSVGYFDSHDPIYLYMMSSITPGNSGGVMCRTTQVADHTSNVQV